MRLYSTSQRDKVELPPPPGPIRMYFCGPTVYQRIHVGNARPFVISMWLKRWLDASGYDTVLVENITDINDKIYNAAPGASAELADQATQWYVEDTDRLGLGRPDHEPRASETIDEIRALIDELIRRDLAYAAGGDVYFRVRNFDGYGRLSGRLGEEEVPLNPSVEEEPSALKEDPRDFALWKAHKEGEDTQWESPWGRGRPGWHIECSAMAEKFLGPAFEIHGGGLDLVFPHHENEVAQSRGAGREFARTWMHNGMLRLAGEKMSKSLGNVISLHEALDRWGRETLLVYFMTAHWRKPMDLSSEVMEQAASQTETLRNAFRSKPQAGGDWTPFAEALDDDFDTPKALAVMHDWRRAGHLDLLRRGLDVFGLASLAKEQAAPAEVVQLAEKRRQARLRREFGESDSLRAEIEAAGWEVRDVEDGYQLVPR
jgi:cysteinyl-tRNA synthetase